ncbi:hypothetical protein GCM10023175_52570 [Pseudonocardia xishanensis]|uniref:Uncharacterized protein n=1 Tax=Pseudonocardia xishanensis TaxID=630995 RepID=A0ABP8S0F7_9PSEU
MTGRVGVGAFAGVSGAGPGAEEGLDLAEDGIEGQPAQGLPGRDAGWQKAWASCGDGDVAVPAEVAAAFDGVQAEAVFEFAVVVFDEPADLCRLNE